MASIWNPVRVFTPELNYYFFQISGAQLFFFSLPELFFFFKNAIAQPFFWGKLKRMIIRICVMVIRIGLDRFRTISQFDKWQNLYQYFKLLDHFQICLWVGGGDVKRWRNLGKILFWFLYFGIIKHLKFNAIFRFFEEGREQGKICSVSLHVISKKIWRGD